MLRRWRWFMIGLLGSSLLGGCSVNRQPQGVIAAYDRLLSPGMIQVAEENLKELGFDPGPVDGTFTEETAQAVRRFQRNYGLMVSGVLDRATRRELIPGLDVPRSGSRGVSILSRRR